MSERNTWRTMAAIYWLSRALPFMAVGGLGYFAYQSYEKSAELNEIKGEKLVSDYINSCQNGTRKHDTKEFGDYFRDAHFPLKISKPEGNIEIPGPS